MIVTLREATDDDMELVMAWRSNTELSKFYYQQGPRPLTWGEHYRWWKSRYNWKMFIIQVNDNVMTRSVGMLTFSGLDGWSPDTGIYIGEIMSWGKGYARQALKLGLEWLKDAGYKKAHATILNNNVRSIRLFESLGFKNVGEARDNRESYYTISL